ncbi:hypothetical protein GCM10009754_53680 [Amycolatopsis minnesotensis]|uniref:DUF5753 domain-containing protein n=1 Tax=Amycolatopsis minnesotensis TaxID=337894 RepID=A0ABP5D2E0_9PSEU
MEFTDHDPVVYVEGGLASIVIEDKDEIAEAKRTAREVAADALDDAFSREVLANLAGVPHRPGPDRRHPSSWRRHRRAATARRRPGSPAARG